MFIQTEARIYPADQRGRSESVGIRCYHTLNFMDYQQPGREPFGKLLVWNEETMAAGKSLKINTAKPTGIFILPLAGGVELVDGNGKSIFVATSESFHFLCLPGNEYEIVNPYPSDIVSYLRIHIEPEFSDINSENEDSEGFEVFSLAAKNQITQVLGKSSKTVTGSMGIYGGRNEDVYSLKNPDHGIFVFIIEGAFEVANRLLEKGDALSLLHVDEVEFEALSNNAIIMISEIKI